MEVKEVKTAGEAWTIAHQFQKDLRTAVEVDYNTEREGVHVSDIFTYCMRQQVFRKLQKVPLTPEEAADFVKGKSAHGAIESLLKHYRDKYTSEEEHRVLWEGITATPDIIHADSGIIFEIKTIKLPKLEKPNEMNVKQLKAYMALKHQRFGFLQYILGGTKSQAQKAEERRTGKRTNPWVTFLVELSKEEGEKIRNQLIARLQAYKIAVERKDPSIAPHVAYDQEFFDRYGNNWKCERCAYTRECEIMRLKENGENLKKKK